MDKYKTYLAEREECKKVWSAFFIREVEKYRVRCRTLHTKHKFSPSKKLKTEFYQHKAVFDYLRKHLLDMFDIKL